ncbi:MAG: hypothetical protein JWO39_807 [Gemmatimonadetes bacterium]|nr:hypothetical protein [Gemmatimonadota bacterium]
MHQHSSPTGSSLRTLALLLLLTSPVAGCTSTHHASFDNTVRQEAITGVTTLSGRKIAFTQPGAAITDDTLYAVSRDGQVILPSDSIGQVWTRKFSPVRTMGLAGGLAAGALLASLIALASSGLTFGP